MGHQSQHSQKHVRTLILDQKEEKVTVQTKTVHDQ